MGRNLHRAFEVQFCGKLAEVALCFYFGLQPSQTINLRPDCADHFDIPLGPIKIDVKGSYWPNAQLLSYSAGRILAGLYDTSPFTHLTLVRGELPAEGETAVQELCGWMSKDDFTRKHLVAPDGHEKAPHFVPGTWYVPVEWCSPIEQLRSCRGPHYDHAGRLIHWCQHPLCGEEACYGYGVSTIRGQLGTWYCPAHQLLED